MFGSSEATRTMTSWMCEHHKSKLLQLCLSWNSFTVSAGGPGTCCSCTGIRDWIWHMLSHFWLFGSTSILSAALLPLLRSCWRVSDLEALVAGSRQTQTNVFLFLFPYHSLHSSVQMLMIHPKGNIYTRCRFLLCEWRFFFFFFHLRLELRWLPETALTTRSTCQCLPGDSTNPAFLSLSTPAFLPPLTLLLPYSTVFSVKSFIFWALFRYFPLLLVSIIPTGTFFSRLQQLCLNKSHNSVLQRVWVRDNWEMTYDFLCLIRGNWHVSWMMKTSIWSGCFYTAVGLINGW